MKTTIVNRVPEQFFHPGEGEAPAPLAEYVASCVALATEQIGVGLGLDRLVMEVGDSRFDPNFESDEHSAKIFLSPGSSPLQQFLQAGYLAFMAITSNALGGTSVIPSRAWPPRSSGYWSPRGAGPFGLWPHMMLGTLFSVENLSPAWGSPFVWYKAAEDRDLQGRREMYGRLYRLALDLRAAVGESDLYRLANPRYVSDRWLVKLDPWLASLSGRAANEVMRALSLRATGAKL